jgi:hypothetical protein
LPLLPLAASGLILGRVGLSGALQDQLGPGGGPRAVADLDLTSAARISTREWQVELRGSSLKTLLQQIRDKKPQPAVAG